MQHILFVCLGNICRSPMAEAIFQQLVADRQLTDQFAVASVATSPEEEGNHPHPGALETLRAHGLDASAHRLPILRGPIPLLRWITATSLTLNAWRLPRRTPLRSTCV